MMKNILLLVLILSIVACSKSADFQAIQKLDNEYTIVSDDVVWNVEEPVGEDPLFNEEEQAVNDEQVREFSETDKTIATTIDHEACKVDIDITSAHGSKLAVHLRDSKTIDTLIDSLSQSHKKFVADSLAGLIPFSENRISKNLVDSGLLLNIRENIKLKSTSVKTDEVLIHANGSADIQLTSVKAKHLIIVANGSVKLKTTSFDVDHATILVRQDSERDQSICVRKTNAGSFDISLNSPQNGSGMIISIGSSLKDVNINSMIIGEGSAKQVWSSSSIKSSKLSISNQVSGKSATALKMSSIHNSSVLIEELSAQSDVSVKASSIKSTKFLIENMSSAGMNLKTSISGNNCGDYRDGDFFLANLGAQEDIGSQCN